MDTWQTFYLAPNRRLLESKISMPCLSVCLNRQREGEIFEAKMVRPRTCPDMSGGRYTQSDSAGGRTGTVRMPVAVYYR